MGDGVVEELVGPLRAALGRLFDAGLSRLSSVEMAALLRELEVERRRLAGIDHRVLAEVDQRGVAGEYARSSTADLLVTMLRVSPGEAKARVAQARDTQPTYLPSGGAAPAVLPRCADAVAAGDISAAHVAVIAKTLDRLPSDVAVEAGSVAESMLVEAARHQHPVALAQTGALLLARLDPDGAEPRDDEVERHRGFTVHRRRDGSRRVSGDWTPELAAIWDAIFDSLAAPLPATDGGSQDERTAAQRRHDALIEAGSRLLRSGELPSANGVPVTVLIRVDADQLTLDDRGDDRGDDRPDDRGDDRADDLTGGISGEFDLGVAQTSTGDFWSPARLRANLGDAAIVPIVIDHSGAALMCGRTTRLATRAQRLALAARDGGCVFPNCTRPAAWCEAHHVIEWLLGGPTDITNLCLLCRYHHRNFARAGWTVRMADGVPEWIPPAFVDPDRGPVRNTVHHPPDLDFGLDVDIGEAG